MPFQSFNQHGARGIPVYTLSPEGFGLTLTMPVMALMGDVPLFPSQSRPLFALSREQVQSWARREDDCVGWPLEHKTFLA